MEAMRKLADKWDFDLFVYGQDVIVADDARTAVTVLEDEKVDFVLVQTTSFSAGFLAPIFAKTRNARLGLWAIPEGAKDGAVPFNSFCGINMYSAIIGHYLNQEKVPLKWFFGNADDPAFLERFRITVCALKAIKKMGQSSVALIGGIAPGFDDLYDDERNLIRLFDGLRINRLHEYDEIKKLAESMDPEQVRQRMAQEIAQSKGFKLGLNYSSWAHDPDEKEVSGTGTARDMVFDPGVVTIARLTGESDRIITKVPFGVKVDGLGEEGEWKRIRYNGKEGYMMSQYLSVSSLSLEQRLAALEARVAKLESGKEEN